MIDHWATEVAPGPELRKWYGHDQDKWDDFRKLYQSGLDQKGDLIYALNQRLLPGPVTFAYAAEGEERNMCPA